jgi:hypothetical protein
VYSWVVRPHQPCRKRTRARATQPRGAEGGIGHDWSLEVTVAGAVADRGRLLSWRGTLEIEQAFEVDAITGEPVE